MGEAFGDETCRELLSRAPGVPPAGLNELVSEVATKLLGVDSATLTVVSQAVLRTLVEFFEVDLAFLRFHDGARRATVLVAEWPPRVDVPDPDPLGVIYFEDADPIFAMTEHLADIHSIRPDQESARYQERVQDASGVALSSVAAIPLRAGDYTSGLLGFTKFGDRGWDDDELRALRTIGLLFAQMQGRVAAEAELRHLADHDELTGLPNRRALLAHLEAVVTSPGPHAVLFVDLDRLKAVNDFLGHDAGDRFILAVADRLRAAVRPTDMIARLGGDEFVVAMAGPTGEEQALALAERVQHAIGEPIRLGGQVLGRTVSIGLALAEPAETGVVEWLRNADQAVLAAKERGGNTIVVFSAEMAAHEQVRIAVEMNLPAAIRDGRLSLHYQPLVDLRAHTVVGVEALVRWNHPTLGPVPPELFVGVAEATNLAGELGDWVLDEASRQLVAWRRVLPEAGSFTLAVNVSPVQLITIDFADSVARVLVRHGLRGCDLILEITEHAVLSDMSAVLRTLHGLRALGVGIAVDDFGTGYSSLAQLKALPLTILKIDSDFVRGLDANPEDQVIVRSIVELAQSFNLDLIADGVDSDRAAEVLLAQGCTTAQGHLFSRPLPAPRLLEWMVAATAPAST